MEIYIEKLHKEAMLPTLGSDHAAGYDLHSCFHTDTVKIISKYNAKHMIECTGGTISLESGDTALIPTGIKMIIPNGYYGAVVPRSGLATKQHMFVANTPGTIDADYRGEVFVAIFNGSDKVIHVDKNMRIAQLIIKKHESATFTVIDSVEAIAATERGAGGFGSTGIK